jgi:DNA-3-methyladenine glycosylase II
MFCFPSAACVADLGAERLLEFGISTAKSNTIFSLAEKVKLGQLSLERPVFTEKQSAEFSRELISFKGVGPWTVNYTFLRGYAFLDGSLHGDAVIRKQVAKLLGKAQIPICDVQDWLMKYRPWRGLLAAHLWALA